MQSSPRERKKVSNIVPLKNSWAYSSRFRPLAMKQSVKKFRPKAIGGTQRSINQSTVACAAVRQGRTCRVGARPQCRSNMSSVTKGQNSYQQEPQEQKTCTPVHPAQKRGGTVRGFGVVSRAAKHGRAGPGKNGTGCRGESCRIRDLLNGFGFSPVPAIVPGELSVTQRRVIPPRYVVGWPRSPMHFALLTGGGWWCQNLTPAHT